jgi:hypothetical protein
VNNELSSMLGMALDDVANSSFVLSLNEHPKTEAIEGRIYMAFPNSGVGFNAESDGRVTAIFFHADGYQEYSAFAGTLPEGILFTDSRQAVQRRLGAPSASGGGTETQFFGKVPTWDRFDRSSYSLHVQYVEGDEAVNLVTLMRPDSVPL